MSRAIVHIAEKLCGEVVLDAQPVGNGRNSSIHQVHTQSGSYAVKAYPPRCQDRRDRFQVEREALLLMEKFQIRSVPRYLKADVHNRVSLMEWIEGSPVVLPDRACIDAVVAFLEKLKHMSAATKELWTSPASESCLSGAEILRQVNLRIAKLDALSGKDDSTKLSHFLNFAFKPAISTIVDHFQFLAQQAGIDVDAPLNKKFRQLIPADLGFHNILQSHENRLCFFDFEYFGWDDPVKLIADFILHPAHSSMPRTVTDYFFNKASSLYTEDPNFLCRLHLFTPLFGLRWCAILLNEFDPVIWMKRQRSGCTSDWQTVKDRQLEKAQRLLQTLLQKVTRQYENTGCYSTEY